MRLSVVVPSYGRPELLARCLAGVARQERTPDEVVVVLRPDDRPAHDAVEACRDALPQARVAHVREHGLVAALNAGLEAATGDVLAMTDDDAVPYPDWLARIEAAFASDDRVAGVGGRDCVWYGERFVPGDPRAPVGRLQWIGRLTTNHHGGAGPPRDVDVLKGANMSYRRALLPAGGFDRRVRPAGRGSQVHNEVGLCLRIRAAGHRLVYDPAIRVEHRPAERPHGDHRDHPAPEAIVDAVHNETFAVLDFLSPARRAVYLRWALVAGTRSAPGVLQAVRLALLREPQPLVRVRAALRGRRLGWRTHRAGRS